MLSHDQVWAAIDTLAARHSLSASGLARRAGLDPTAFNRSKRMSADGRPRWPSTESLSKILVATDSSLDDFMAMLRGTARGAIARSGLSPRNVPLLGFAQAGAGGFFDDAGFPAGEGWDVVDLPAAAPEGTYALQVQGESMQPLYRDGDVLIVQPGATVRRGDRVVVRTAGGEVMAKVLARHTARIVELHSLNPDHAPRSFAPAEVEWIARILWASQ